ncbi:MAG: hypothetical protein ACOYYS_07390 [Chloroflexota bacterium]
MSRRTLWLILAGILFVPTLLAGLVWLNLRLVALNPQDANFIVYWTRTRELFFHNHSPYTPETMVQLQSEVYGRPARPGEYAFASTYPLYTTVLFAPFALVDDYNLARAIWLAVSALVALACVFLAVHLVAWRPPLWLLVLFAFFTVIWVHGFLPLLSGNVVLWAFFFLLLSLAAVRAERYEFAGFFLAWVTVQALPFLLVGVFILLWSISRRKWVLPVFWLGMVALLTTVGMFFQPGWPVDFLRMALHYSPYPPPDTLGETLALWWPGVGRQVGWVMTALIALVLLVEWWSALRKDFRWFLWACCLTLVLNQWAGIPTSPEAFVSLSLPLMLVFATWNERNPLGGRVLAIVTLLILSGGLWPIFWAGRPAYPWPQIPPALFVPVPLLLFVLLYWVRWWAVKPRIAYGTTLSHTGVSP